MRTTQALEAQPAVAPFWTMPVRLQFGQFSELHNFMVVNVKTNVAVESHFGSGRTINALNVLNAHAERNSHTDRYEAFRILKQVRVAGGRA